MQEGWFILENLFIHLNNVSKFMKKKKKKSTLFVAAMFLLCSNQLHRKTKKKNTFGSKKVEDAYIIQTKVIDIV
jgi:hypothetical protein